MFQDRSGMFKDFGFKLVVINSLLNTETSFSEQLKVMKSKYVDNWKGTAYSCISEIVEYFEKLVLCKEDLEKVKTLSFDGGNDIYFLIMPDWDGESAEFEVHDVSDYILLPNLKEVEYIAMCNPKLMEVFNLNNISVV